MPDTSSVLEIISEFLAPASDEVKGVQCRSDSLSYIRNLRSGAAWATKMWDSSAKLQSGLLTGNLNSLGNFDECINIKDVQDDGNRTFGGQHCLATFKLENISVTDAMGEMLKEVMEQEEDLNVGLGGLLSKGLHWGYCIPSSCTSEDLSEGLLDFIGKKSGVSVSISSTDCHFDEEPLNSTDYVGMTIFTLLMLVVFLSTFYEIWKVYLSRKCAFRNIFKSFRRWSIPYQPATEVEPLMPQDLPEQSEPLAETGRAGSPQNTPLAGESGPQSQEETAPQETSQPQSTSESSASGGHFPTESQAKSGETLSTGPPPQSQTQGRPQSLDLPAQSQSRTESGSLDRSHSPSPTDLDRGLAPEGRIAQIRREEEISLLPNEDPLPIAVPTELDCDPFASFSLFSNWKKIFSFQDSAVLSSLFGIRFLSICLVVLGSECFVMESLPAINYVSVRNHVSHCSAMFILTTSLAVDTFMVVTGALISYHFLKDMKKRGIYRRDSNSISETGMSWKFFSQYLPLYYCHRHIRLTPALAAMVLFQVSILGRLGSGPFWNTGNGYLANVCHDNWWVTVTYLQNYIGTDRICISQSWYLAVDMQFYVISPFLFIVLMSWSRTRSYFAIGVLAAMGILVSFLVNFFLALPIGVTTEDPSKWHLKNRFDYHAPYTRFGPWMIGVAVGYTLYLFMRNGRIELNIKPRFLLGGWILASVALLYPVIGVYPFSLPSYEYNAFWASVYSSVYHTIWALGIGWIIVVCESNNGGFVQAMLSWKVFQPLSRLTYCIFLVHLPLMTSRALMTRVPIHIDNFGTISSFLGDILFSILLAVALSLMVETPFIRLFKLLTMKLNFPFRHTTPQLEQPMQHRPQIHDLEEAPRSPERSPVSSPGQYGATASTSQPARLETITEIESQSSSESGQQDETESASVQQAQSTPEVLTASAQMEVPQNTSTPEDSETK